MELLKKFWAWLTLERTNHLATIALAVVAIFGYFYTVVPVYQKERLAEQVADYEGQIKKLKPQIAETEAHLTELQRERQKVVQDAAREREKLTQDAAHQRAEAQREQNRLITELKNTERQLYAAREEKAKIERQTEFMVYRYRLPDGSPAMTREQVKIAQLTDLKKSFASDLSYCASGLRASKPFSKFGKPRDDKDASYPFSQEERNIWKEYETRYPLKAATDCIAATAATYTQRYPAFSADTESLRKEAVDYANAAAANKLWTSPVQPEDVIQELANTRKQIEKERAAALKKNEEEYGDWQSIILSDRREIYRRNYEIQKYNANVTANMALLSLGWKFRETADELRTAIEKEVVRLTTRDTKGADDRAAKK